MKTPIYETSPGALEALLETNSFVCADIYTYELVGGGVLRYATSDIDIVFDGHTYVTRPLHGSAGAMPRGHWKVGLDVDTWQVGVMPRAIDAITGTAFPDRIGDADWITAASIGVLDDAMVRVDRVYAPSWPTSPAAWGTPGFAITGVLTIFLGYVAEVDFDGAKVIVNINDARERLNQLLPPNSFQAACRHILFDAGCALSAASFATDGSCGSGSTSRQIVSSVTTAPGSGTFSQGRIVMTSGNNIGFSRAVRKWNSGIFDLMAPLPYAVAIGDTFTAYPGCDKTQTHCANFSNSDNFGGEPFIPAAETAT